MLLITRPPFEDTVYHEEVNVTGTIQAVKACVEIMYRKFSASTVLFMERLNHFQQKKYE